MEIRYKLYPYPVLTPYSNDYETGTFDTAVDIVRDGYDLRLEFSAALNCQSLQDLISRGSAKYVYHLECAQTGFRTVVQTDRLKEVFTLSGKMINGSLQICPFIVAVQDIEDYASPYFHEDYQGTSFNIEAGCVMAAGQTVIVDISKDIDDLSNTPSIFIISKNSDESCRQMQVDMDQRKIIIKLPINDFYCYKALSSSPPALPLLNSLTIVPALVYVLGKLQALSSEERSYYSNELWYKVLSRVLAAQFSCNIETEELNQQDSLILAQKLIDTPVTDAFSFLTSSFGEEGGDD